MGIELIFADVISLSCCHIYIAICIIKEYVFLYQITSMMYTSGHILSYISCAEVYKLSVKVYTVWAVGQMFLHFFMTIPDVLLKALSELTPWSHVVLVDSVPTGQEKLR